MVELGRSVGRGVTSLVEKARMLNPNYRKAKSLTKLIAAIDEYHRTHLSDEEYKATRMLVMLPGGVIGIEHPDAPKTEFANGEAK